MDKLHTFVVLAYKESKYLEECIKSVINQKYKSKVVIATSTPNQYIKKIAQKHNLEIIINEGEKGIGNDFDFAIGCGKTPLVTIAHQDDIYNYEYSYRVVEAHKKNRNPLILFTDYYEIKNNEKIHTNINLKIKRVLLLPLKIRQLSGIKFFKRMILSFGDPICCPAVTFVKEKTGSKVFQSDMKCDVDWLAWERLSKKEGQFIFIKDHLMGHRVHEESTTTEIISNNIRTNEDYEILKKFWPKAIAKIIAKLYKNSEKSNKLQK